VSLRAVALTGCVAVLAVVAAAVIPADGGGSPSIEPLRVTSDTGIATGFAIAAGRVVTSAHAVDGASTITVRAGRRTLRARPLEIDRRSDMALLAVAGVRGRRPGIDGAEDGDALRLVRVRDGHSSVMDVAVRRAIVANVRAPGADHSLRRPALEVEARLVSGDSGAPLVTHSGELAGMIFAASRTRPSTAYAVDASALRRLLER
jgi:S1-C subfamily serine protease